MSVIIDGEFLGEMRQLFESVPEVAANAAAGALNHVATREGMTMLRRDMEAQVAFPAGYLASEDHMYASRTATPTSLEAAIAGRDRPTSLARFAPGQDIASTRGKKIIIQVKRGVTRVIKRGFMVNLKNGNRGLAIRLKPGEKPTGTTKAVLLDNNVYLLYGPSVDQVLGTIAQSEMPALMDMVASEFSRQFVWKGFK